MLEKLVEACFEPIRTSDEVIDGCCIVQWTSDVYILQGHILMA